MICKIQVVTIGEDGRKETREITSIQRTDVKPETLGLTLAEGKMILKDLQQIVVESQVSSLLLPKRTCPDCGEPRCSKGNHTLSVRRWTDRGAHLLLQVRTKVLNEDWRSTLSHWYPGMEDTCDAKAA
jgi:hypothetical protein